MYITEFSADGFRNLRQVQFQPDAHCNLITGNNAQGKTSLLDAIWLMTGCKNFHGVQEQHYLGFSADYFRCSMKFRDDRREQVLSYQLTRKERAKQITINGVTTAKPADLFETFHCVAFSPADMELIDGTPERRRSFMDLCACQLQPEKMHFFNRANRLLNQRNAGIQQAIRQGSSRQDVLLWDTQLAKASAVITRMRAAYIRQLAPVCSELYGIITGGREELEISYRSAILAELNESGETQELPDESTLAQAYQARLACRLEEDFRLGYTRSGIHRDKLGILIQGKPVHIFGSQGQKKTVALVLKLAQAYLYREKWKHSPVILLDDVMGELDTQRQRLIYDAVSDMQVFITLCHASSLKLTETGKIFEMQGGILTAV